MTNALWSVSLKAALAYARDVFERRVMLLDTLCERADDMTQREQCATPPDGGGASYGQNEPPRPFSAN